MKRFLFLLFFVFFVLSSCGSKNKGVRPENVSNPSNLLPSTQKEIKFSAEVYRTLTGHHQYVFYTDFSPNGEVLASGSADQTVRLWNIEAGKQIFEMENKYDEIWGIPLEFSPNGRYLVIGAYEVVKVLDLQDGNRVIATNFAHKRGVQSLSISPDDHYLVTAGVDGELIVWTLPDLHPVANVKAHNSEIWNVDVSPDGKEVLSGGEDSTAKVWSLPNLKLLKTIRYHKSPIEYVRYSRDGKRFLLASADSTTSVWNRWGSEIEPLSVLTGHVGGVLVATFTADGLFVLSGGEDDLILVHNISQKKPQLILKEHFGDIMTLSVSSDGRYFASGSRDRTIKIWKITEQ